MLLATGPRNDDKGSVVAWAAVAAAVAGALAWAWVIRRRRRAS